MGDELAKIDGQPDGHTEKPKSTDRRRGNGSKQQAANANNTESGGPQTGRTQTAGTDLPIVVDEKGDVPRLVPVDAPKKTTSRKKKKKSVPVPDNQLSFVTAQLTELLGVTFSITASRIGEHWRLTREEAEQLAKPTVNILDKNGLLSKLVNSADYIALGIAGAAIFAPRIAAQIQISKMMKGDVNNVRNIQTQARGNEPERKPESPSVPPGSGRIDGIDSANLQPASKELLDAGIVQDF